MAATAIVDITTGGIGDMHTAAVTIITMPAAARIQHTTAAQGTIMHTSTTPAAAVTTTALHHPAVATTAKAMTEEIMTGMTTVTNIVTSCLSYKMALCNQHRAIFLFTDESHFLLIAHRQFKYQEVCIM